MRVLGVPLIQAAATVALVLTAAALLLALFRLVRGPTLPDRVVALDLSGTVAVGFIAAYSIATGSAAILEAAAVLALIGFLATVAFARYLERRGYDE